MANIFENYAGPIGAVCSSLLTLAQFQALYGKGWVLMDGGDCTGSIFSSVTGFSNVPDARGLVLRGSNNGRSDGKENPETKALGEYQGDVFKEHAHTASSSGSGSVGISNAGNIYASGSARGAMASGGSTGVGISVSTTIDSTGDIKETRMRNITVNHFIRIN